MNKKPVSKKPANARTKQKALARKPTGADLVAKREQPLSCKDADGETRITERGFAQIAKAFAVSANGAPVGEDVAILLHQLSQTMPFGDPKTLDAERLNFVIETMAALAPKNRFEAIIASQMVGLHATGMEFLRRSVNPEATVDTVDRNINRATRLLRVFGQLADTYRSERCGGKQKIIVRHVSVNAGGQAIVGAVSRGGVGE